MSNSKKAARSFDLDSILQQTLLTAKGRSEECRSNAEEREEKERSEKEEEERAAKEAEKSASTKDNSRVKTTESTFNTSRPSSSAPSKDDKSKIQSKTVLPSKTGKSKWDDSSSDSDTETRQKDAAKSDASEDEEDREDDEDDDDDEGEEAYNRYERIPAKESATVTHGTKPVSAIGLDPAGARFVSGSHDYQVRFYDFNAMDSDLKPFREITPCEAHPIKQLVYSPNGENILVVAGENAFEYLRINHHPAFVSIPTNPCISPRQETLKPK